MTAIATSGRGRSGAILFFLLLGVAGCANPPQPAETVWVSVADVYTPGEMQKSFNRRLAVRFAEEGFTQKDFEKGRLLRVACGLGTDYTWGSYAYLPAGLRAAKGGVFSLRINQSGTDDRMGTNPIIGPVNDFKWPGVLSAYRYIPDWREKGLALNFERLPLEPGQQGRYVISHGSYVIKCRQHSGRVE